MKISERANRIASKDEWELQLNRGMYVIRERHVLQALDEWQASVEERLATVGARQPHEIREMGTGKLLGHVGVPISDPGPSKWDEEKEGEE